MRSLLNDKRHSVGVLLIHGGLHECHDALPAYSAQPEVGVAVKKLYLRELRPDLLQLMKNASGVNVVDGNESLLVRDGDVLLFGINCCTSHLLLLARSQKECSHLFLGLLSPDPHEEVAVKSEDLILTLHIEHRDDHRLLVLLTFLREKAVEIH